MFLIYANNFNPYNQFKAGTTLDGENEQSMHSVIAGQKHTATEW